MRQPRKQYAVRHFIVQRLLLLAEIECLTIDKYTHPAEQCPPFVVITALLGLPVEFSKALLHILAVDSQTVELNHILQRVVSTSTLEGILPLTALTCLVTQTDTALVERLCGQIELLGIGCTTDFSCESSHRSIHLVLEVSHKDVLTLDGLVRHSLALAHLQLADVLSFSLSLTLLYEPHYTLCKNLRRSPLGNSNEPH